MTIRDEVMAALTDPTWFPDEFKGWITRWIEQNPPTLTIGNIAGLTSFLNAQVSVITTSQSTASLTYADLTTAGPSFANLGSGSWAFVYGALVTPGASATGYASLSVNAGTPVDTAAAQSNAIVSSVGFTQVSFSASSNAVKVQYRNSNANATSFANRWLVGLKLSN